MSVAKAPKITKNSWNETKEKTKIFRLVFFYLHEIDVDENVVVN